MPIFETCLIWIDAQTGKDGGYFTHEQGKLTPCTSPSAPFMNIKDKKQHRSPSN
jgi:hypothetical protein